MDGWEYAESSGRLDGEGGGSCMYRVGTGYPVKLWFFGSSPHETDRRQRHRAGKSGLSTKKTHSSRPLHRVEVGGETSLF